jgi:hypothetical protein
MKQLTQSTLSLSRALAEREARRRREVVGRCENLVAALDAVCEARAHALSEEQIGAALLIVMQRRAAQAADEEARRRWPIVTGRNWGEL